MAASGKKWWWILTGLVVFAGLLIGGWYFFKKDLAKPGSKIAKPLLTDQLKKIINKASDGLYELTYDRFELNIDSGKGFITGLKIEGDTSIYKNLVAKKNAPNNLLSLKIDTVIIQKFGFIKTDSGRRFGVKSIIIKRPVIVINNKRRDYNDTVKSRSSLIKGLVKDLLQMSSVEHVTVNNMTLVYVNKNENHIKKTIVKNWNLSISDFSLANLNDYNSRTPSKKMAAIVLRRFSISTPDSLYRMTLSNLRLFPQQRSMYIERAVVNPRLNKIAFYQKSGFNRDRLHVVSNGIAMHNIDIARILTRQQVHLGSMFVKSSWVEVFNNYHWPQRKRPPLKYVYPHERLQLLAFDITIDTIKMRNGYFRYAIAAKKSKKTASFFMTDMKSDIYHVTNNTLEIKKNPYLICKATNLTMGTANTHVKYVFNLASEKGAFTAYMHMGPMNARAINPVAAPLGLMEAKSGIINGMDMYIHANRKTAKGNIDLYYKGLKLNLLKRDKDTDTLKKRGFLSFLTNAVMPNDNPKGNGKFRKGPINVTRDPRMSFFGLLWKCTQDGMSSAVTGIEQKKEKPDENPVIQVIDGVFKPARKQKQLKKDMD